MGTLRIGNTPNDEYYTTEKTAKDFINTIEKYLKSTDTILCPCDSEESEIVKEFKRRGYKVIFEAGDYKTTLEKYKGQYDVIATNPPFSCWAQFNRDMEATGKKYFIFACMTSVKYPLWERSISLGRIKYKNNKSITTDIVSNLNINPKTKKVSDWLAKHPNLNPNDFIGTITLFYDNYDLSDYDIFKLKDTGVRARLIRK